MQAVKQQDLTRQMWVAQQLHASCWQRHVMHQQQESVHGHGTGSCKGALPPILRCLQGPRLEAEAIRLCHTTTLFGTTWVPVRRGLTSSSACRLFSRFRLKACRAATSASLDGKARCGILSCTAGAHTARQAANLGYRLAAQTHPAPASCLSTEAGFDSPDTLCACKLPLHGGSRPVSTPGGLSPLSRYRACQQLKQAQQLQHVNAGVL